MSETNPYAYQHVEAGHVSLCLTGQFAFAMDPWLSTRSTRLI